MSVFGVFLVRIFPHSDWIPPRIQSESRKIRTKKTPNTDTFHTVCSKNMNSRFWLDAMPLVMPTSACCCSTLFFIAIDVWSVIPSKNNLDSAKRALITDLKNINFVQIWYLSLNLLIFEKGRIQPTFYCCKSFVQFSFIRYDLQRFLKNSCAVKEADVVYDFH